MSTKKITLNPDFLKINTKKRSRKNNNSSNNSNNSNNTEGGSIILNEKSKRYSANLVKNQILNKIRQNHRKILENGEDTQIPIHIKDENHEFENSIKYFENLKKNQQNSLTEDTIQQQTKNIIQQQTENAIQQQTANLINYQKSNIIPQTAGSTQQQSTNIVLNGENNNYPLNINNPVYGCLKGGSLPTYRQLKYTLKQPKYDNINTDIKINDNPSAFIGGTPFYKPPDIINNEFINQLDPTEQQKEHIEKLMLERNQINISNEILKKHIPLKKRIITRRRYDVGKSKTHPKVSVLLSNKSMRSKILTEQQNYNTIPINEIKNILQKKGFIKVGSNSPNNILRELYKNIMLMGGDIVNHSKETLIYNFLHNNNSGDGIQ